MIRFACPKCKTVLETPEQNAGSMVVCGRCQERLQVPGSLQNKTVLGILLPDESPMGHHAAPQPAPTRTPPEIPKTAARSPTPTQPPRTNTAPAPLRRPAKAVAKPIVSPPIATDPDDEKEHGTSRLPTLMVSALIVLIIAATAGYGVLHYIREHEPNRNRDRARAADTGPNLARSVSPAAPVEARRRVGSDGQTSPRLGRDVLPPSRDLTGQLPGAPPSTAPGVQTIIPRSPFGPSVPKPTLPPASAGTSRPDSPLARPPSRDPNASEGPDAAVVVKRLDDASDEELRKQLLSVPVVGLNQGAAALLYTPLAGGAALPRARRRGSSAPAVEAEYGPHFLAWLGKQQNRPNMAYFPWQEGVDCQLGKEAAEQLHVLSLHLRTCLRSATPNGDVRPDADRLRTLLIGGRSQPLLFPGLRTTGEIKPSEWRQAGAVPALTQLLQAENTPLRLLLIELLSQIDGKEATRALVQRALYDLSARVREKAIQALARRPVTQYRQLLLDNFRHPWPPVAQHAAEALVALRDRDAVPALVNLLREPDPRLPILVRTGTAALVPEADATDSLSRQGDKKHRRVLAKRELVRLNHMSNCMVCHAPSLSKADLVRGRIPIPGEDPPPLYYAEQSGLFVRADTTFLRQDFSVVQPVANAGKWPGEERFDYLVRFRPLSRAEETRVERQQKSDTPATFEQREAELFALRELTGENPGSTYDDWSRVVKPAAMDRTPTEPKPAKAG